MIPTAPTKPKSKKVDTGLICPVCKLPVMIPPSWVGQRTGLIRNMCQSCNNIAYQKTLKLRKKDPFHGVSLSDTSPISVTEYSGSDGQVKVTITVENIQYPADCKVLPDLIGKCAKIALGYAVDRFVDARRRTGPARPRVASSEREATKVLDRVDEPQQPEVVGGRDDGGRAE